MVQILLEIVLKTSTYMHDVDYNTPRERLGAPFERVAMLSHGIMRRVYRSSSYCWVGRQESVQKQERTWGFRQGRHYCAVLGL